MPLGPNRLRAAAYKRVNYSATRPLMLQIGCSCASPFLDPAAEMIARAYGSKPLLCHNPPFALPESILGNDGRRIVIATRAFR